MSCQGTDLQPTKWNPYPELMPKKDCYGIRENFSTGCSVYGTINEPVQDLFPKNSASFYMPSQAIVRFSPLVPSSARGASSAMGMGGVPQGANPLATKWTM